MLGALLLVASIAAQPAAVDMDRLTDEFSEELLALRPLLATTVGDHRFDDRLALDIGEPHRQRRRDLYRSYLTRLEKIAPAGLSPAERLTYRVFRRDLRVALEGLEFPDHLLPISYSIESLPNQLAALAAAESAQPFATAADYDAFRQRIADFPNWVELALTNMELGIERGIVQPCALVDRAIGEISALLVEDPRRSVFYQPIGRFPVAIEGDGRRRLAVAQTEVIAGRVLPAYRRLRDYLVGRYRPACRESAGLGALPDGARWYAWQIESHTTTRLNPDEIFAMGRKEIQRIRHEMEQLMRQLGFGRDWSAFFESLRSRREEWLYEGDEVLAEYRAIGERLRYRAARQGLEPPAGARLSRRPLPRHRRRGARPLVRLAGAGAGVQAGAVEDQRVVAAGRAQAGAPVRRAGVSPTGAGRWGAAARSSGGEDRRLDRGEEARPAG